MNRKLVSILLVAAMTAGLVAGCGSKETATDDKQGSSEQKQEEVKGDEKQEESSEEVVEENYDPFGKYEEPVVLTSAKELWGVITYDPNIPEVASVDDNIWLNTYKDELGIDLEYVWTSPSDTYTEKWNSVLATGDIPDIGYVPWSIYEQLRDADMLEDMTEYFENYASDLFKEYVAMDAVGKEYITVDGKMYGVPTVGLLGEATNHLWIRSDWLKTVGLEAPKTIDEVVDIAQAFVDNKLGGDNTIGLAVCKAAEDSWCGFDGFLNGYEAYVKAWVKGEDGSYEFSMVQPQMKEALRTLQGMYANGLLPVDFAAKSRPEVSEMIVAGQAGMLYGCYCTTVSELLETFNNDPWICVPAPSLDGSLSKAVSKDKPNYFLYVKKGIEHPEAAIKLVNLGLSIKNNEHPDALKYMTSDTGNVVSYASIDPFNTMPQQMLMGYRNVKAAHESGDPAQIEALGQAWVDVYNGGIKDWLEGNIDIYATGAERNNQLCFMDAASITTQMYEEGHILIDGLKGYLPTDLNAAYNDINTILWAEYVNIIMGQDIDTFDAAVEAWYKNGGNEVAEFVNK